MHAAWGQVPRPHISATIFLTIPPFPNPNPLSPEISEISNDAEPGPHRIPYNPKFHAIRISLPFRGVMELPDASSYAEAHHIQPLGNPHNGPDILENILCLCPNHHAELDYGVRPLALTLLRLSEIHPIGGKFIDYHNQKIHRPPNAEAQSQSRSQTVETEPEN